ncbi:hypothetical protein GFS60_07712 (plasmid) [Rhodococcus sp. WAY2]|nr:hypothetical protein GFS60_07712 [Rhodococcus sp. WAY2]
MLGGRDVVPQRLQPGMQRRRRRAQDSVEALVDEAAAALPRMRVGGVAAGRAVMPDGEGGAVLAAWLVQGAGDDGRGPAAGTTPCRASLAGRTPRSSGGSGCAAELFFAADRTRSGREGRAADADRAVRRAGADWPAAPAIEADFEVVRVSDQAVRAERPALFVSCRGLAVRAAARAFFDTAVGDAGAADALSVEGFVDPNDPVAARACRSDDPGDVCGVKGLDQRNDGPDWSEMASAG